MIFNMKRIKYLAILALLGLSSCTQEFNYDPTQEIQENAENIFGLIDPNQDWRTTTSGTVTVTANANLDDIAKVQILTESPFLNPNAKILAEADATLGQTVTLPYDAPRGTETLIAACVDSKGHHYITPFKLTDEQVSFQTAVSATRSATRAEGDIDVSGVTLDASSAQKSLNALRNIYADLAKQTQDPYMVEQAQKQNNYLWEGTNWSSEMLWQLSDNSTIGGDWKIVNGTVLKKADPITTAENEKLTAIFNAILPKYSNLAYLKQYDNMEAIRNSAAVRFFKGHLTSTGEPITIIPVQMSSKDLYKCDLYYYYYNPNNVPSGISEEDYIKQLPKFKAIHCDYTKNASGVEELEFFKVHEYLLPYYGDGTMLTSGKCPTDGIVYRIRNGYQKNKKSYYITYRGADYFNSDKMDVLYDDNNANLANQLWQIFTTEDGKKILYNIGSQKFLTGVGQYINTNSNGWGTFFAESKSVAKELAFEMDDMGNGAHRLWYNRSKSQLLGANSANNNPRVATNKTTNDGTLVDWYFDEYEGSQSINKLEFLTVDGNPNNNVAVSASIPKGYRVGFMLRKINVPSEGKTLQAYINTNNNGCVYGNGELNTVINKFPGHWQESVGVYSMKVNDTRIAMFNANNKTYLAFEDGNDCNYSDMIIEVVGNSGEMFDDVQEVEGLPYTMCFEDRPNIADYDMNDVVLRCIRLSPTQLELSLLATGANDEVYIEGISGKHISGTDLNNKEVHELFGVSTKTFVNTEPSASVHSYVTAVYEVSEFATIPQFLTNIYIRNKSRADDKIRVPEKGEPPFALIVPGDFDYPAERISIVNAYSGFRNWANNAYNYDGWLDSYDDTKLYINPFNRKTN